MLALIFPGQGSQHLGMGKFLFDEFKTARELFEEASDTLSLDFKKLIFESSEEELKKTENTQPALVLTSYMYFRCLKQEGALPFQASAGHSLGEYSAALSSEAISFADAIRSVRIRGQAMQDAVPAGEGAMLAILGIDDSLVNEICAWASKTSKLGVLEPANYNCPGQVVISGSAKTADWLTKNFDPDAFGGRVKKLKAIPLKVSAPFHCSLMKPAQDLMSKVLEEVSFNDAKQPIFQNVSASAETKASSLRENLVTQVSSPVRWAESIRSMRSSGVDQFLEVGPGKVLTGLVKKIDSEGIQTFNMENLEDFKSIIKEFEA